MELSSEIFNNIFYEFAFLLLAGAVFGTIGHWLKQPLIVAFIGAGILVGPSGIDIIQSYDNIHLLAEIGITLLLFVVGLKLDFNEIKTLGAISLLTGLGQVLFTSVVGFAIAKALGYEAITSLYIAIALTFSSTIIIVKLLSDKQEIDSLHGRIAIGFLIVQDIVVIIMMIVLSGLGLQQAGGEQSAAMQFAFLGVKSLGLVMLIPFLNRLVFPRLLPKIAINQELLILFAIAFAVFIAALAEFLGVGKEIGAFIAGVALASSEYKEAITGRLATLRDFLLFFFFIHLGSQLDIANLGQEFLDSAILSLFVLIGNPIIVLIIMGIMGYSKRTGFLAGLTVAQISEFSLVFAAMGLALGHINENTVGLITLVGLITIALSTYMILYSAPLYEKLAPYLSIFEKGENIQRQDAEDVEQKGDIDIIVIGLGRYGRNILSHLDKQGRNVLGVDFDPGIVHSLKKKGQNTLYGDIEDPELIKYLPIKNTKVIISTITHLASNMSFISYLKEADYQGKVMSTVHYKSHGKKLEEHGADLIIVPYEDAVENFCSKLDFLDSPTG